MKRLILAVLALTSVMRPARAAQPSADDPLKIATSHLEARQATMQEGAAPGDVDRALSYCASSLVYEHPRVGIRLTGIDAVRAGMVQFLGTSRKGTIKVTDSLSGRDMVAVETRVAFEGREEQAWRPVERRQVWVFELEGSKIKRILEYW